MTIVAILLTIMVGWAGSSLGYEFMNFPELGSILAIATMGGFIMTTIRKNHHG